MLKARYMFFPSVLLAAGLLHAADEVKPKKEFACHFVSEPITIDGNGDEAAWKSAEVIDHFYLPWLMDAPQARSATRARLLWDRENLYFFADMDDGDLYADVKEHDGQTWDNDVFELFLKPAEDKPGYYEFQVSAAGTVMDMFLPRRGAGGFRRFIADGDFHIESKVALRGTLNQWTDKDQGWSVEGRIPWRGFLRSGGRPEVNERWKFAICRYDYSVDFEGPELSTCAPLGSLPHPDFHRFEDYATLKFGGPDKVGHHGDARTQGVAQLKQAMLSLSHRVVGSPDPPLPYRAKRVLPELKPSFPIFVGAEPGSDRLFIIDQKWSYGPARICSTTATPGELETLLEFPESGVGYSLAFHPKYEENGYLYVGWNGLREGEKRSIVSRYTIDRSAPHALLKESELTILEWASDGHNGAAIAFGMDGLFYVTTGDGTSDSDTNIKGQGVDHLLAKLLRIDVDHPEENRPYSIPSDNPFVGHKNARTETWAYGFRNPWRITVDPKRGDVWVGNNGQDLWEQAYLVAKGANYGWSVYEGSHLFYANRDLGQTPISKPTVEHPHSEARSLTGGIVYYGRKIPELTGAYIYGDYSTGKIWAVRVEDGKVTWHKAVADTTLQPTCFAIDGDGELLISDHRGNGEGGFYTLEPSPANDDTAPFPRKLSDTGLFTSVAGHHVHPGLLPYCVNAPLWSDGAYKERYLYLPPAENAPLPEPIDNGAHKNRSEEPKLATFDLTSDDRGWNLPDGTVVVKSFAFEGAVEVKRRWIETRLLVKQQGEWAGYSYAWNDEQNEATLVDSEGLDRAYTFPSAKEENRHQTWRFPSRAECMVCHSRAANYMLGLSTIQFNKSHDYGSYRVNQLEMLESLGVLRVNYLAEEHAAFREEVKKAGLDEKEIESALQRLTATRDQRDAKSSSLLLRSPEHYPKLVDPYDANNELPARAKSYLHSNCAQCHVEAGGGNSQMQLAWSSPLEKMKIVDVAPVHHKFDLVDPRLVAPGEPARSVLLQRMAHRGRGQMPQLATNVVDMRAVELMREWIESLKPANVTNGE